MRPQTHLTKHLSGFDQSKTALDQANSSLTTLIHEHSAWQAIHDLLNTISDQVDPELLKPTWASQDGRRRVFSRSATTGGAAYIRGAYRVGASLEAGNVPALNEAVGEFRTLARLHFSRLDRQLLERCEDLGELRSALQTLLKSMDAHVPAEEVAA